MAIVHKFIGDLNEIELAQMFCGQQIDPNSKILIIGTHNPDKHSCVKPNEAKWFYGRKKSNFWRYLPMALTGQSLHLNDNGTPAIWKEYCITNKIVIIDLVKSIKTNYVLPNFGDRMVEQQILTDLGNTDYFNVGAGFKGITFEKVIYSLAWSDSKIPNLKKIRDIVNKSLIQNGCIQGHHQIEYCLTPSRNDQRTKDFWYQAVNG